MSKEQFQAALCAIAHITEFEVDTYQKTAIQSCLPLIESSYDLLCELESLLDLSTSLNNKDLKRIEKVICHAKSKLSKIH